MDGAGLCIGVSTYSDSKFTSCPSAARTAQALALALGPCLSNGVVAVVDPKQSYELFLALQSAVQKARGGLFLLYFAGMTIRRGDDFLLTTSGSGRDAKDNCVPWSDIDAILEKENVARGLVIMNAEGFAGVGWPGAAQAKIYGMGSVRIHDPLVAEQRIAAFGDAVLDALCKSAHDLKEHLVDGRLDVAALAHYLTARFPTPKGEEGARPKRGEAPRHETFGSPEMPVDVVLRDAREELARPPPRSSSRLARPAEAAVSSTGSRLWLVAVLIVAAAAGALFLLLRP